MNVMTGNSGAKRMVVASTATSCVIHTGIVLTVVTRETVQW